MDPALKAFREEREHPSDKPPDARSQAQRDRDRILYTVQLRRLADITQVVSANEGPVFHNRLTHSLEVAQFGRRLAEKLVRNHSVAAEAMGGIDPDVVESACLAHDIGHPPFGHVAERELARLVTGAGVRSGFEGNAQSFRIVTKLASHPPSLRGLNLTRATLDAILKYPWLPKTPGTPPSKWGAYDSEFLQLRFVRRATILNADEAAESEWAGQIENERELVPEELDWAKKMSVLRNSEKSLEANIMDWADDVTYAVHDAVDFYRAGLIPMDRLASRKDDSERQRFFDDVLERHSRTHVPLPHPKEQLEKAFSEIVLEFPNLGPFRGSNQQQSNLINHSAFLIKRYIDGVNLENSRSHELSIDPELKKEVFMLKQLTWSYVILNPKLATQQHGHRRIISDLFEVYRKFAVENKDLTVFPTGIREQVERSITDTSRIRIVADFISGMSERQAVVIHQKLTGIFLGSVLDSGTELA
jgi:dGTPase